MTVVGWIDVFTRAGYCDEIIKNLNYCIDKKGLKVFAFCIMPSHIHMIAKADDGINLSDVMRDFKSYTAKQLLKID
jgi:REP element-mobilizing transposase RayT